MEISSVGPPQFYFDDDVTDGDIEIVAEFGEPVGRSTALVLMSGLIAVMVVMIVFWRVRDDVPALSEARVVLAATNVALEPDALYLEQLADGVAYTVRPVGNSSVFIATETPEGFFGLRRAEDGWFPTHSTDGIDWMIDLTSPITGVPETFEPGARRSGPVPLQYVDGMYWGRFVSRRLAGASGAMLTMKSTDGVRWELPDELQFGLDEHWFNGTRYTGVGDFEILDGLIYALSPGRAVRMVDVPDVDSDWQIVDVAASSHGAALLFYNGDNRSFRVAVSADGETWITTALAERGDVAVEIVVVGSNSVLLRAANVEGAPVELIISLPRVDRSLDWFPSSTSSSRPS